MHKSQELHEIAYKTLKLIRLIVIDVGARKLSSKWFTSGPTFQFYDHSQQLPQHHFKILYRVTKHQIFYVGR